MKKSLIIKAVASVIRTMEGEVNFKVEVIGSKVNGFSNSVLVTAYNGVEEKEISVTIHKTKDIAVARCEEIKKEIEQYLESKKK